MARRFRRLSQRSGDPAPAPDVLHEGIPAHLRSTVGLFIREVCSEFDPQLGQYAPSESRLRSIERAIEVSLDWESRYHALSKLVELALNDAVIGLDVLDYLASVGGNGAQKRALADALTEAGSAWRLASDFTALERRVDETVTAAAAVATSHGKAGQHLALAWAAVYGVDPDPSTAYSQSIKAVEVAAHAVVIPNDSLATLGKVVAEMKANPAKFVVVIAGAGEIASKGDTDAVTIARLMAQLLWTGQHDRHGNFDPSQPVSVSQEEAEAAVHLAALLVQWFEMGAIAVR